MEVAAGQAPTASLWRDSLHVTCGLTAYIPGSAPGPTLGNEYGKTLPFTFNLPVNIATLNNSFCPQYTSYSTYLARSASLRIKVQGEWGM